MTEFEKLVQNYQDAKEGLTEYIDQNITSDSEQHDDDRRVMSYKLVLGIIVDSQLTANKELLNDAFNALIEELEREDV